MTTVERSTVIDAPLDAVWSMLRDFNAHDRWHPAVATSRLEGASSSDQVRAVRSFRLATGEHLRERLVSMSDRDHSFRYAIVESEVPLENYVAEVRLKPVTDGDRTFWSWRSTFDTPPGRETELAELVATGVYEAGFEAIRARVERPARLTARTATVTGPSPASAPSGADVTGMAVRVERYGDPDVLRPAPVAAPPPGPGEVRLQQSAIGVNFIDVYCRTGYFDLVRPPAVPGMEAAGVVLDVGPGVEHVAPGQRVAYACPPAGAYATVRTMSAALVVPLPDHVDDVTAAAGLLKGMTAHFLLHQVHVLEPGETVLVYAPAGGVGRLLVQWASRLGATVIGATSSEEKARVARDAGARHVIVPGELSLEAQVMAITDGQGADVVYDAVGADTFAHSVAALAPCGHLVSFGQASGDIGTWDIGSLASRSATVSRPNYAHYTDTPEKIALASKALFDAVARRIVTIEVGQRFPLSRAAEAHRALEGRRTTRSTVLVPDERWGG